MTKVKIWYLLSRQIRMVGVWREINHNSLIQYLMELGSKKKISTIRAKRVVIILMLLMFPTCSICVMRYVCTNKWKTYFHYQNICQSHLTDTWSRKQILRQRPAETQIKKIVVKIFMRFSKKCQLKKEICFICNYGTVR